MIPIDQFFKGITSDFDLLYTHADASQQQRSQRLTALALRIGGMVLGLFAAGTFLASMLMVAGAPFSAVCLLISTTGSVVLAHDGMVVGANMSKKLGAFTFGCGGRGLLAKGANFVKKIARVSEMAFAEIRSDTPYEFHGTWLVERLYASF